MFPGLGLEEEEDDEEEDAYVFFYLWKDNKDLYSLYKILTNYLQEHYLIDSAILLALIRDSTLPLQETLSYIPYLHNGYRSKLARQRTNGNENS